MGRFQGDLLFAWAPRDTVSCPPQTITILERVAVSPPGVQAAFDGCARIMEACYALPHLASARLALNVAALDALSRSENPKGSFKEFAARFMPELNPKVAGRLYGQLRSGFVHAGATHLRERSRSTRMTDADGHERLDFAFRSHGALRRGVIRWMEENLCIKWDPSLAMDADSVA